jgi:hypothetical protein
MDLINKELEKASEYLKTSNNINMTIEEIGQQLKLLTRGIKVPKLVRPCKIGDGIIRLKEEDFDELLKNFTSASLARKITKFIPASGAASRMFHKGHSILNRFGDFNFDELVNNSKNDSECKSVLDFLNNIQKFAFYQDIKNILNKNDEEIKSLILKSPSTILKTVMFVEGLNYAFKPKAAIKFHTYPEENRTAFEEQIFESLHYVADKDNRLKIHFTISEEHTDLFQDLTKTAKLKLATTDFKIDITYSYQKKHTDTIIVNLNNEIFYNNKGTLVRRQSGHGALLENLNEINGDIVVIKNIDNVTVEKFNKDTILYKKLLVGLLVKIQKKVFDYLELLDKNNLNESELNEILNYLEKYLSISKPTEFDFWDYDKKKDFLVKYLDRPIRICGMVKNEGEPGGGPFWVEDEMSNLSLQIIEQAQIDMQDENQKSIFNKSTHFNPVDLVCGVKNYKGNNFNLKKFIDRESGIVTKKSKNGNEVKVLELPGLWNGSMAYWNTIFVEVPISTFNPVKEVNDLLNPAHQN